MSHLRAKHDLDDYNVFNNQNVEGRSKGAAVNKICYERYEPVTITHNSRKCNNRRICKNCDQNIQLAFINTYQEKKGDGRSKAQGDTIENATFANKTLCYK